MADHPQEARRFPARLRRFRARDDRPLRRAQGRGADGDSGIVRNRAKIEGTIANARGYLRLREEGGSFDGFLWQFTDGRTLQGRRGALSEVPAQTAESRAMSKALRRRGFKFVGPTICYAFMQAIGMVNDHVTGCFRHQALAGP